jgi:hypothetical protein
MKLEASLKELHQLFLDMSLLVEAQGELLNQIEFSVESAVAYTEKGVQELEKAKEYQKSARKVTHRIFETDGLENALHLLLCHHLCSCHYGNYSWCAQGSQHPLTPVYNRNES